MNDLAQNLNASTEEVAAKITIVWDELVELASFFEQDVYLRKEQQEGRISNYMQPLALDERREMTGLITSLSSFVRSFPTGRRRDDEAGQFQYRRELLASAQTVFLTGSKHGVLTQQDYELLLRLLEAAKRGDFKAQGGKAGAASVVSAKNFILSILSLYTGAVLSTAAPEIPLIQKSAEALINAHDAVVEIMETAPAGVQEAVAEILDDLKKRKKEGRSPFRQPHALKPEDEDLEE